MIIDISSTLDGDRHRIAILYQTTGTVEVIDFTGTYQQFYDNYVMFFALPSSMYYKEDLRGDKSFAGKFFCGLRLE